MAVIKLPPLRERAGDISLLINQFMEHINEDDDNEPNHKHKKLSASARNLLLQHPWPGNVRELQNTLTRAAVWSVGENVTFEDIQEALFPVSSRHKSEDSILNKQLNNGINLPEIIEKVATHYLERGLTETHGNKRKTAELLGLPSYQTLTNWLKKYKLE